MSLINRTFLLSVLIVLVSCFVVTSYAKTCSQDDGPTNCQVCDTASYQSNVLATLPRVNRKFQPVKNNLGFYDIFTCTNGENCKTASPDLAAGAQNNKDLTNYVDSIVIYLAFGILMFVLSLLTGVFIGVFRYCCCCYICCRCQCAKNCCEGGCCGKKYPTERTRCIGFQQDPETGAYAYPKKERWVVRGYMLSFVICICIFIGIGYFNGNREIPTSMKAWADSPSGFANIVYKTSDPVGNLFNNLASQTLTSVATNLNTTIQNVVPFDGLAQQFNCIVGYVNNLPNTGVILNFLDQILVAVGGLKVIFSQDVPSGLNNVTLQINSIKSATNNLKNNLTLISNNIASTKTQVSLLSTQISYVNSNITQITSATDGTAAVATELGYVTGTNYPTSSDVLAAAGASAATPSSLQKLAANAQLPQSEAATLSTQLNSLQTKLAAAPDFVSTASKMTLFNTRLDNFVQTKLLDQIINNIDVTSALLNSTSASIDNVNTTLGILTVKVSTFNLNGVKTVMINTNATLNTVPDFAVLFQQLDTVRPLRNVMPCLNKALEYVVNINTTLFVVGAKVNDIFKVRDDLNGTLDKAVNTVDSLKTTVDSYTQKRKTLGLDAKVADLTKTENQVRNYSSLLSGDGYLSQLSDVKAKIVINFSVRSNLVTLNQSVVTNKIDTSLINSVSSLGGVVNPLKTAFQILNDDMNIYKATGGQATCKNNPGTNCNQDSQCTTAGDRCLVDPTRINNIIAALNGMVNNKPNVGPAVSSVNQIQTDSNINLGPLQTDIASAQTSLNNANPASFSSNIDGVISGANQFDVSASTNDLTSINSTINSLDFSDSKTQVNSLNSSIANMNDKLELLNKTRDLSTTLNKFFNVKLKAWLDSLSAQSLTNARIAAGGSLAGSLAQITSVFDDMTGFLTASSSYTNLSNVHLTKDTESLRSRLDTLSGNVEYSKGPFHYLMRLFSEGSIYTGATDADRVTEDVNGVAFPSGKYCVTRACLYNTIDYINSQPISKFSSIPAPLTREQLLALPYVLPLIAALLALIAAALYKKKNAVIWLTSFSNCCIFVQMPIIFLIIGIIFPLAIVVSDVCYGLENIGHQYIVQKDVTMCTGLGGTGTLNACTVKVYDSSNITVDIPKFYNSIFGVCDPSNDEVQNVLHSLRNTVSTLTDSQVNKVIDNMDSSFGNPGSTLPALKNVFKNGGTSLSQILTTFVDDLSNTYTCTALHDVFGSIKKAMCCNTMTNIYFIVSSWYLIAFSMYLCGCGSNLLGRKRFADELWGPAYEAKEMEAKELNEAEATQQLEMAQQASQANAQQQLVTPAKGNSVMPINPPIGNQLASPVPIYTQPRAVVLPVVSVVPPHQSSEGHRQV